MFYCQENVIQRDMLIDKVSSKIEKISLDSIDLSDETFKISSDNDLVSLANSIDRSGLIHLPILQKIDKDNKTFAEDKNQKQYRVVCGFKRLSAIKSLVSYQSCISEKEIFANIVDCDKRSCAIIAISENSFQRQLNTMEQARAVHLLKQFLSIEEIAANSSLIFNMNMNRNLINTLDDIANMPKSVHTVVENERLAMGAALKFRQYGYDFAVIDSFVRLFSKIKTSLNKQKEIITHIHEIAARESVSIIDVIDSDYIKRVVEDSENDTDENRKGNLVRSILFERRYPNISKAKEKFNMNLKHLNSKGYLKGDIKLDPPADFEGRDYTVSFKFSNVDEFEQKAETILALSKNRWIDRVISSNI